MRWLIVALIGIIIIVYMNCDCNQEGFSLSKKPMEADWSLFDRNPFDDVDYITPAIYPSR